MEVDWKEKLTPEQYHVLRAAGTEPPFTDNFHDNKKKGLYSCAGCGRILFSSASKFDSGTGWPSFFEAEKDAVSAKKDFKMILPRTEVLCNGCGGHLGHVFKDGPRPTGKRYCINGVALQFEESKQ